MAYQLRALLAFPKKKTLGSISSIYMAAHILSDAFFWPLKALLLRGTKPCMWANHPYAQNSKREKRKVKLETHREIKGKCTCVFIYKNAMLCV